MTTDRPRILDLFCCAGGAGSGYARSGFAVYGIDNNPKNHRDYPFDGRLGDVMQELLSHVYGINDRPPLPEFDAVHASPPCQAHTALTKGTNRETHSYVDLIDETRHWLRRIGKPYIIENVEQSTVRQDLKLCGEMFGLRVLKHRIFEIEGFTVPQPEHIKHKGRAAGWRHGDRPEEPYYFSVYGTGGSRGTIEQWREAMEMPWAGTKRQLSEAIPPRYTEYIGKHLLTHLNNL
ncbi:DNA methyltransferase [Arthrobacter phage Amigo]|uniref:DNA methyltransferase n=5 Tax=Amigovirus amigo TaxID=1982100 RepID=A0A5J6TF46_9CAUD|nr:DNA methyltransferase [Arthrobacter phage Amigo]QFG08367.1 DNA methyltransferase [Arthrobacter phage Yeezus]QFG13416.1 DNA methyltransferase [Arthrobacter phage Ichor]QFG13934.1 DNA methyltransferase [Arthrobacter phage Jaek]QJD51721.1 DNA methyltransferase [Arthrobacter phage Boersma]ALY08440.1 DNA methyltransferase [Arthrobacter phage Amigo]